MEEQGGQGGGRRNPLPAGGLSSNAAPHRYAARHRGYGYMLAALEWHTDKGVRYLRVRVDGKTGGVIPPISTGPKSRTVMQPWPNAALG